MKEFSTVEAGAGSYPEPPDDYEKDYVITLNCNCKANVFIQAKSSKEAENILKEANLYDLRYKYDLEFDEVEIEEIIKIEEE